MASVDLAAAHDDVGRREIDQVVASVIFRLAGDAADLAERTLVEQPVDALADGEPSAIVLALHLVGAAHALRHFLTAAQLVHFRLPAHLDVSPNRFVGTFPALEVRTNEDPDRLE